MDAIPAFYVDETSTIRRLRGRKPERTASGKMRARIGYDVAVYAIEIASDLLTTAERNALVNFYIAHADQTFLWTSWEPVPRTFAVDWVDEIDDQHVGGDWWVVKLKLEGVAA